MTTDNNGFILPLFSTVIKKNPQGVQFRCPIYKKCKIVKPLQEIVMIEIEAYDNFQRLIPVQKCTFLIHLKTVNFLLPVCLDMQFLHGYGQLQLFLDVVDVVTTELYLLQVKI